MGLGAQPGPVSGLTLGPGRRKRSPQVTQQGHAARSPKVTQQHGLKLLPDSSHAREGWTPHPAPAFPQHLCSALPWGVLQGDPPLSPRPGHSRSCCSEISQSWLPHGRELSGQGSWLHCPLSSSGSPRWVFTHRITRRCTPPPQGAEHCGKEGRGSPSRPASWWGHCLSLLPALPLRPPGGLGGLQAPGTPAAPGEGLWGREAGQPQATGRRRLFVQALSFPAGA